MGYGVRGLASPLPFLGATRCAVRIVLRLWTSPVITQLNFLQYFENVVVPQFLSSTECSRLQLCFRGVHAQCKLCKSQRFHRAVLRRFLRARCCALTGAGDGPDSAENREDSFPFLDLVHCASLCNDRCRIVETVQTSVESPQLVPKLLTCPCWPRHGVVDFPQLQFIDWCVSSSWL